MKYFCVSDIHGHYDELKEALNKSGFDESNNNHMLMVIGDMVDRGPKCVEVLEYIYYLRSEGKAIVIMGNHDLFLLDFLFFRTERTVFNFLRNGHKTTIEQLLGRDVDSESDFIDEAKGIEERHPYLKGFLSSLETYYEIGDYVFVHGGVDATKENWRDDVLKTFVWTRMLDKPKIKDKIMVVGHTPAFYVRCVREERDSDEIEENNVELKHYYDPLDEGDIIHIDGGVYSGGRINVLILDL